MHSIRRECRLLNISKALSLESKIEIHTLQLFINFFFFEKISKYILLDIHYIQEKSFFAPFMLKLYQELMRLYLFETYHNWLLLLNIPFKLQLI